MLGEGADLYVVRVPDSLIGRTLASSGIGADTGLSVLALRVDGELRSSPTAASELTRGTELVMVGTSEQREEFARRFA
jgi:K+/H+ antiporter YhaU regulatory subunit KhtT